ncbi:MAG: F420-0--gamma-glutamyl ligase, partial [Pseudoflavonifractor sp.]
MDFTANEGKSVTIEAGGKTYARHAIQTHFVGVGESYIDLMNQYVVPCYETGDILSMSEKVIALCQGRVVTEAEVKPGFWAKVLSRCVHQTAAGPGMGLPVKMQFAINVCGLGRVLWAAICAALDKLRGVHGTFY